jgi:hypothetical protein
MGSTRSVVVKSPRVSQEGLEEWSRELPLGPDDGFRFTNCFLLVNRGGIDRRYIEDLGESVRSTFAVAENGVYSADELAAAGAQFAYSLLDDPLEDALAFGKKRNENLAAILLATGSADVAVFFETVDQFDGAVMTNEQAVCQGLDFGRGTSGKAANGKQQQILLGFESGGAGGGIAFTKEKANAIAEFRHGLVFGRGNSFH